MTLSSQLPSCNSCLGSKILKLSSHCCTMLSVQNQSGLPFLDVTSASDEEDWRNVYYAPLPDWVHYSIGVLLVISIYLGTHGNLLTVYIFLSTKSLKTPQNMFLINLAIVDLVMVLSCQPIFCVASFLTYYPSVDLCPFFGSLANFGGLCSINSMAIIAFDRYVMICSNQDGKITPSIKRSLKIIAAVWGYTLIFAILPNVGIGGFILNGGGTSCSFDYISRDWPNRVNLLLMYVCGFIFPLTVCIFCYMRVFAIVHESGKKQTTNSDAAANKAKNKEILVVKASVLCIGVFLVTWLPYAIVGLIGQLAGPQYLGPYIATLPALLAKTNCIYNPIIYGLGHPSFKKELKRRLTGP